MESPSLLKPVLLVSGGIIMLAAMKAAASFIVPILLAVFFATLLSPVYNWLKQRRVPGGVALLLTISVLAVIALIMALLVGQSLTTLAASLGSYTNLFGQRQSELTALTSSLSETIDWKSLVSAIDPAVLSSALSFTVGTVTGIFKSGVLILMVTIFILAESSLFILRMNSSLGSDHFLTKNVKTISQMMISYFGLRALVNLATAAATGLMLWLLGIENAGLWTVLIFFLSFIPYIGAFFAMLPPLLLAYAQGGLGLVMVVLLLSVVINSITENIVSPLVMGKGLSISPTVVFLSFIFWMFILGGAGAFLAMPLTMALLLFMGSYDETRDIATMLMTIPETEAKP